MAHRRIHAGPTVADLRAVNEQLLIAGLREQKLAREHTPDLILLDAHLPDMMGDELLRRLQMDPRTRDIPVVILGADTAPSHIARLREAGAAAYLPKPLDVNGFLATLEEVLTKRKG